jgi:hypothetical protein
MCLLKKPLGLIFRVVAINFSLLGIKTEKTNVAMKVTLLLFLHNYYKSDWVKGAKQCLYPLNKLIVVN